VVWQCHKLLVCPSFPRCLDLRRQAGCRRLNLAACRDEGSVTRDGSGGPAGKPVPACIQAGEIDGGIRIVPLEGAGCPDLPGEARERGLNLRHTACDSQCLPFTLCPGFKSPYFVLQAKGPVQDRRGVRHLS
jgi:hypothetical protein